jgi:hypothetical protein
MALLQPNFGFGIFEPFADYGWEREWPMRTIEIWPDEIEGGDTERGGATYATMRFIDHDAETAVVVFLQQEAERGMIANLYGWAQSRGMTGRSN